MKKLSLFISLGMLTMTSCSNDVTESESANDQYGMINGHAYVDLGLSVLWATCNIGAESPEDYGDYFAWGETSTKSSYDSDDNITYGKDISTLESEGIVDSSGILTRDYDAASVNWSSTWRMPTYYEFRELIDNCEWEWIDKGVSGYKVTGSNGNSIFLPAAGGITFTSVGNTGEEGKYWSSSVYKGTESDYGYIYAYGLSFSQSSHGGGTFIRYYGRPVRPVSE